MKVKIIKASKPTYWYAKKIGQVFEIGEYNLDKYKTVIAINGKALRLIDRCDVEPLDFSGLTKNEFVERLKTRRDKHYKFLFEKEEKLNNLPNGMLITVEGIRLIQEIDKLKGRISEVNAIIEDLGVQIPKKNKK